MYTINIPVDSLSKEYIVKNEELINIISRAENELAGFGRVLVRASGTENVIRVLVEGENAKLVNSICNEICLCIYKLI